jgi:hypothetical protein
MALRAGLIELSPTGRQAKPSADGKPDLLQVFFSDSLKSEFVHSLDKPSAVVCQQLRGKYDIFLLLLGKVIEPLALLKSELSDLPLNLAIMQKEPSKAACARSLATEYSQSIGI